MNTINTLVVNNGDVALENIPVIGWALLLDLFFFFYNNNKDKRAERNITVVGSMSCAINSAKQCKTKKNKKKTSSSFASVIITHLCSTKYGFWRDTRVHTTRDRSTARAYTVRIQVESQASNLPIKILTGVQKNDKELTEPKEKKNKP
jgi:hypothetical protein